MNKIRVFLHILIFFGTAIFGSVGPAFAGRPEYHGYSPAIPKTSELPLSGLRFPFILNEKNILLEIEIDQTGAFKKALPKTTTDSAVLNYILSSLKNLTFEQAVKEDRPVASTLPVRATVSPRFQSIAVEFPVGADFQITSRSLYFRSLELLGIEFPEIKTFPPYFCDLSPRDSLNFLPFALIRLNLNDSGQINSSEIIETTLPAFAGQVESAALWANIAPLKLEGKGVSSNTFLLVSFFPQLQYPTSQFEFKEDSSYQWHERWRVQLLPDTVGMMMPAMPKNRDIIELTLSGKDRLTFGDVTANLIVDTHGDVKVRSIDTKNPPLHKAVAFALKDLKFFPATDFNGSPVNFNGKARFLFRNNSKVQVEYLWLDE